MAVGLREERDREIRRRKLTVVPGGKRVENRTDEYEFPYDDLKFLYDYIKKEFGTE